MNSVVLNAAFVSVERRRDGALVWPDCSRIPRAGAALVALMDAPCELRGNFRWDLLPRQRANGAVPISPCWSARKLSSARSDQVLPPASAAKRAFAFERCQNTENRPAGRSTMVVRMSEEVRVSEEELDD